ncbi:hypothetical protein JTB14_020626 [Gonioctena quinquepunctata]|nr:hypothetical protein JTB14_020626 [Gonioctena quinquepunctata]
MREFLIQDINAPVFENHHTKNKQTKNQSIRNILNTSKHCFSIELCPNRYLDTKLLSEIESRFSSVTWHLPSELGLIDVGRIPAIRFAEQLSGSGNVLMHLAGRNLRSCQVLRILDVVKSFGVRNIFALQGGL